MGPAYAVPGAESRGRGAATIMRHFGIDGVEQRLPQERHNLEAVYPAKKSPPSTAPPQP